MIALHTIIFMCIIMIILMIISIIKIPQIKIKGREISTFWIIPSIFVIILILFDFIPIKDIWKGLTENSSINPLKIICLFFSMTFISIVLDEIGFFEYLANKTLQNSKSKQIKLFIILYVLTSILTIFTSNDIIILTFTPFIIFFAKKAKISPIPYLVSEFVAANTWSMLFIIGNPTNIYLASSNSLCFIDYFKVMFLPTLFGGISSLIILILLFYKKLSKPIDIQETNVKIKHKGILIFALSILIVCTIMLVISSYVEIEMYLISLISAIILLIITFIFSLKENSFSYILNPIKRLPWNLIPFVISMFIVVLTLKDYQVTNLIEDGLNNKNSILTYGITSTLSCNFINNIPMSVLFSEIIPSNNLGALYATIIGSNIGAFLTPIGALAGIMWLSILKKHNVNYSFSSFIKYGVIVAIPTLIISLIGLMIII